MAVLPFFKIVVKGNKRDISNLVTSFAYERSIEKDDLLSLTFEFDSVDEVDDEDLVEGKILIFKYGVVGGKISKRRTVKIKSAIPSFDTKIKLIVKCHDLGTDYKRTTSKTIWKGKTSSQIAAEIADARGLGKNIETTKKVWADMPQGNKSEYELLEYLADREENGDFIFFISGDVLNFVKRDLGKKSQATYAYEDGDGGVISFKPSYKEAEAEPEAAAVSMNPFDVLVNNENVEDTNTGEETITFDANAIVTGGTRKIAAKGKELVTPVEDKQEAINLAKSSKKKAVLKTLVAKLVMEIEPLLEVNSIITMKNVGQKYSGNWYVTDIADSIRDKGISTVGLSRNSTKKPIRSSTDTNTGDINKDVGPNEPGSTIELINFDSNSNIIGSE